jgi:hypothetical protein
MMLPGIGQRYEGLNRLMQDSEPGFRRSIHAIELAQTDLDYADLSDQLAEFTADLVSLRRHEPFLVKLFSKEVGSWLDVISFCLALGSAPHTLKPLQEALDGALFATWLDHPEASDGYCTVLFFAPDALWSNAVVYHKQRLSPKRTQLQNGVDS